MHSIHPDPAEYNYNLELEINNTTHDNTYITHIQNRATQAQTPLNMIQALTATTRGKQKHSW